MKWLLRFVWVLVGLLGLAALGVAIYMWRASPKLNGELRTLGLSAAVKIQRDAADVTHISAQTDRDAAFALGYIHAQERSWQLEFNRRVMHGRLSEFLGEATVETDKLMRTLGIVQSAQAQFANLPASTKDTLQAYADGINAFHATGRQALPPEFHILGIKPGIWTPQDSVGWLIMMSLDLGGNWGTEIARASAAKVLDTSRVWQLYPVYEGEKPRATADIAKLYREWGVYRASAASAPAKPASAASASIPKNIATNDVNTRTEEQFSFKNALPMPREALVARLSADLADLVHKLGHGDSHQTGIGSNNWLVAGSHSASGKPLLANDPHLGLNSPAIWYFAALKTPSTQAIGATLPGSPMLVLGRNTRVAWGFTNTGPDVQDVFLERIDPANPKRYQTPDGFAEFQLRPETIGVKGKPDVNITVRSTRHGPVLSDSLKSYDWVNTASFALSLRFAGLDADVKSAHAGMLVPKVKSVAELYANFSDFHSPMQNVVAADIDGGVGYKAVGRIPLRDPANDFMGLAPSPGWDAKYDWKGWLPYADTPYDDGKKSNRRADGSSDFAKRGWLATANQRIHDPAYPHFITQDWGSDYRQRRIEELLAATAKHDAASFAKLHGDVKSLATVRLLPHFRAAIAAAAPGVIPDAQAAEAKSWDGTMRGDSLLPLIFSAWIDQFTRDVLPHRIGDARFNAQYGRRQFRAGVENILETNDAFFCKKEAAGVTADCPAAAANAMNLAMANLRLRLGPDLAKWSWAHEHRAISKHQPFGNVAPLARFFDVASPSAGDGFTVNVGQYDFKDKAAPFANRHAASLRAIYDLSDLEKSQFIYQTGQSGLVWSKRYKDMAQPWSEVQYRPLQLKPSSYVHELSLVPR